jgi:hypothetical protein
MGIGFEVATATATATATAIGLIYRQPPWVVQMR